MALPDNVPPDDVMECLGLLCYAPVIADHGCDLAAKDHDGAVLRIIRNDVIEELAARGWVDLSVDEQVTVTEKGRYWADRWKRSQEKKRQWVGNLVIRSMVRTHRAGLGGCTTRSVIKPSAASAALKEKA